MPTMSFRSAMPAPDFVLSESSAMAIADVSQVTLANLVSLQGRCTVITGGAQGLGKVKLTLQGTSKMRLS